MSNFFYCVPWVGNINGEVVSPSLALPQLINSFSLVNKEASAVTANVYLISDYGQVSIAPLNQSISAGAMYEGDRAILVTAGSQIKIQTSGSVDYDFTLSNTISP